MSQRSELWAHRIIRLAFVIICIRIFPRAGVLIADLLPIERWGALWDAARSGVQLLLSLAVMLLLSRSFSFRDIGFNLNHASWSLKTAGLFTLFWTAAAALWVLLFSSPLDPGAGDLVYAFTLSGLSDEVLFRAFVIGMLHPVFAHTFPLFRKGISVAGLISVVLFAAAGVAISFTPFSISTIDPLSQSLALAMGVLYAVMFEYSHSLLGPILIHNLSNGILLAAVLVIRQFGA